MPLRPLTDDKQNDYDEGGKPECRSLETMDRRRAEPMQHEIDRQIDLGIVHLPEKGAIMRKRLACQLVVMTVWIVSATVGVSAEETLRYYLSGRGRHDAIPWKFFCTSGRRNGMWTEIPVPSNWELHGFGAYNYGHDEEKADEKGKYRCYFDVPTEWKGKSVNIVFEGVMTDAEVWINGASVGPRHQGGFYRFKYDITELVNYGKQNLLEVTVSKVSSNPTVEAAERAADYWVFGGIYRPVYLEVLPGEHIEWTAIDARADGSFRIDVYLGNVSKAERVSARIQTLEGQDVGQAFSARIERNHDGITLRTRVSGQKNWTAETPNLYQVRVALKRDGGEIHSVIERFGFRTLEVRPGEGLFLNGRRIMLKGVNRHSFRPDSGRCLSPRINYEDVRLIKEMNMNAVRMSHYPPDAHFLEACDELGVYVLDELAGWQRPPYDREVGTRLIREMVVRDVNHPCILFWDNANEGGWNPELDTEFAKYDPQKRTVLHPSGFIWGLHSMGDGEWISDIDTDHYLEYEDLKTRLADKLIVLPTELLHGLYDGGHGAGLDDYWNLMNRSPQGAGGFLWVMADEGMVRTDRNGAIDVDGNHAPDGIVGPYHEKEGSFYTIREIWSPIQIALENLPADFDGHIEVENTFDFTDLGQCRFEWKLVRFPGPWDSDTRPEIRAGGSIPGPATDPGAKGVIDLELPADWRSADALYLTGFDHHDREVWTWTWPIREPVAYCTELFGTQNGSVQVTESEDSISVVSGTLTVEFDPTTASLISLSPGGRRMPFSAGPRFVGEAAERSRATIERTVSTSSRPDGSFVIEGRDVEGLDLVRWTVMPDGVLKLDYSYHASGPVDFLGVSFDCPQDQILGIRRLGAGPFRVWKNRMKGTTLGVWQNEYNDGIPGEAWTYPEFKGYFADLVWAVLHTKQGSILIAAETEDIFLRILTPKSGKEPHNTHPAFPDGDISMLHAIPPMGTKFLAPQFLGPESQKTEADGTYSGTLYFAFP